jgi:hypothetical protein
MGILKKIKKCLDNVDARYKHEDYERNYLSENNTRSGAKKLAAV